VKKCYNVEKMSDKWTLRSVDRQAGLVSKYRDANREGDDNKEHVPTNKSIIKQKEQESKRCMDDWERLLATRARSSAYIIVFVVLLSASSCRVSGESAESFESLPLISQQTLVSTSANSSVTTLASDDIDPLLATASSSQVQGQQTLSASQHATTPTLPSSSLWAPSTSTGPTKLVVQVFSEPPIDHDALFSQSSKSTTDLNVVLGKHGSIDHMEAESANHEPSSKPQHIILDQQPSNVKHQLIGNQQQQAVSGHSQWDRQPGIWREQDITLAQSAAGKRPPVYKSAPKQISGLSEIMHTKKEKAEIEQNRSPMKKVGDLHTAAGHYKSNTKKSMKKKKKHVKSYYHHKQYKKKRKVKKTKKKVKKMNKPITKYHHAPKASYGDHHNYGKYYEYVSPTLTIAYELPQLTLSTVLPHLHAIAGRYRSVPKKGAWQFGHKRGNPKHTGEFHC